LIDKSYRAITQPTGGRMKTLMTDLILATVWILIPMLIDFRAGVAAIMIAIIYNSWAS
jgi:hypothetical protein